MTASARTTIASITLVRTAVQALVVGMLAMLLAVTFGVTAASASGAGAGADEPDAGDSGADAAAEVGPTARGTTWTIEPADAEGNDGRISLRHEIEPGRSATDLVQVTNFSDHEATFRIYASDGVITADGVFDILPPDSAPEAGGSWISVDDQPAGAAVEITVAASESTTLPISIEVPDHATPGDHPAGVVAELVNQSGGVTMQTRVGTRVHLRVAGDVVPSLTIQTPTADYRPSWNPVQPGSTVVDYTITNEGNVRLGGTPEFEIGGPFGWGSLAVTGADHREILPGQSVSGRVVLDGVWPLGPTSLSASVTPVAVGDDIVNGPLTSAQTETSFWAVPWIQLAILLLLVLALWWRRRRKSRSEKSTQARIDAAVAAAVKETSTTHPGSESEPRTVPAPAKPDAGEPTAVPAGAATIDPASEESAQPALR